MPPKARSGDIQRTLPVTSDASFTKKKWRPSDRSYVYRFSDHRTNSVSTPGMIPKDGLTLYPTKGNLSLNMVDWKRALILLVSKQYPHLDDVLRTERYTPAMIPSMLKAEENLLSDLEKELKILDAKELYMKNKTIVGAMPIVFDIMIGLCSSESLREPQIHYAKGVAASKDMG